MEPQHLLRLVVCFRRWITKQLLQLIFLYANGTDVGHFPIAFLL